MKKTTIVPIAVILGLILIGVAFWGGVHFGNRRGNNFSNRGIMNWEKGAGQNFGAGMMNGGKNLKGSADAGILSGEVTAKDNETITVKTKDGGSRIIFYSHSTAITKSTSGTIHDVAAGANLMITGSTNTDGSLTATIIQIRSAAETTPVPSTAETK